jgi:hypothetical protein
VIIPAHQAGGGEGRRGSQNLHGACCSTGFEVGKKQCGYANTQKGEFYMPEHNTVQIDIDQHNCESPNPTTGAVLYTLGNVTAGIELFREVNGKTEDEPIENGPEVVQLKNGDHFRSGPHKAITIYVNGEQKQVSTKRLSFEELAKIAYPIPPAGDNLLYTVSYEDGPPPNPQGSMKEGETLKVKNGMIFNVTATDKS